MIAAQSLIKPHRPSRILKHASGNTHDIIQVVREVERTDRDDTEAFARQFRPTKRGLKKLYWWVKHNIRYKEDPHGQQWIQTPSYLNYTKEGDCKSLTVFICSVLWNMGLDYIIRFTTDNAKAKFVTHVYPIAILPGGQRVVIDTVLGERQRAKTGKLRNLFDKEGRRYITKDYKIKNMSRIYKLGNISPQPVQQAIEDLEKFDAAVPDSIITAGPGDVTRMSEGQFERYLMQERMELMAANANSDSAREKYQGAARAIATGSIAGISGLDSAIQRDLSKFLTKTATKRGAAFKIPDLPIDPRVSGLFGKLKKLFKKAFKKFLNFITKGPIKLIAPYFLFLFIKKRLKNREARRRQKAQMKTFNWIAKVTKYDKKKLAGVMHNGILKKTGQSPKQILNKAAGQKIGALGAAAIIQLGLGAVKHVIGLIQKISKLFKKKNRDAGDINKANASDISLLAEEGAEETSRSQSGGGSTTKKRGSQPNQRSDSGSGGGSSRSDDSGGGSSGGLLLGAGLLAAMTMMT